MKITRLKKLLASSLTPSFDVKTTPKTWIPNNRAKFHNWVDTTFKLSKEASLAFESAKASCTTKVDSVRLFPHQEFIKDYIQFDSPYRGILLYHGLGVGKSCSSIAAAEILMNKLDVAVLLPASLKGNYISEVKKCGRRFYATRQHWEFVSIESFQDHLEDIAELSKLTSTFLTNMKGIWVPLPDRDPNYHLLSGTAQSNINAQIDAMITARYTFYSYNGLTTTKLQEMIKEGNPFDNKCIVIDEVHNMVSGMVNQRKIGSALYKLLWSAKNCKIIMLSGTPIINFPYEVSFIINLLSGPKIQHRLKVSKTSGFKEAEIRAALESYPSIDFFHLDPNTNSIHVTFLPDGFEYVDRKALAVRRVETSSSIDELAEYLSKRSVKILKVRDSVEYKLLPEDEEEFNKLFVDMEKGVMRNEYLFARRILGTVSFYSAYSPELYPKWTMEDTKEFMTDVQFPVYEKSRLLERKKESNKSGNGGNIFKDSGQVYRFYSRANCNFVFPETIKRPYPSLELMTKEMDDVDTVNVSKEEPTESTSDAKAYEKAIGDALLQLATAPQNYLALPNLGKYSPKFKKVIERIQSINGTAMVYSQFRKVEGLGVLSLAMNANGFAEFKIKKVGGSWVLDIAPEDMNKPKYISFTGNTEETQILLKIFNSDLDNIPKTIREAFPKNASNIRGSMIKVLMITKSGAEGISLKNVRQVHVLEPYWNHIRIDQVVGRAIRTCSHVDLPENDRNVNVFVYTLGFTKTQLEKSFTLKAKDDSMTSDEYIYRLAKKKAAIVNNLLEVMKRSSVDCALNAKSHGNMKCFALPVNISPDTLLYKLDIQQDTLDEQHVREVSQNEWKGEVLITKKGNFLIRPETNEVYDYDIYLESGKLVKIGILENVSNTRKEIRREKN